MPKKGEFTKSKTFVRKKSTIHDLCEFLKYSST